MNSPAPHLDDVPVPAKHPQHHSEYPQQHISELHVQHPPQGLTGGRKWWFSILLLVGLAMGGTGVGVGMLKGAIPNPFEAKMATTPVPQAQGEVTPQVKVIRPKRETSLAITVDQIVTVEPYYRSDLRARASGIVKQVHRDIGEKVEKGDVLVEIDVPESDHDVAKCEALILQRLQELKVSEAKWKDSIAAKDVSAATIKQRQADVQAFTATRDLRKRRFERFRELAAKGSVVGSVVEEEERDYLASEAVVTSSSANVERALADYAESTSKIETAAADIELKKSQVEVARKDLDRAKAIADYAKVLAPYDGVVVRRTVDPGSFVQNATTGSSESLISIARVDLVTVVAKLPDTVASAIGTNTRAVIQIHDLPGVTIAATVTRFAPSVQNVDRTMRVEVDLFNGDEAEYERLVKAVKAGGPDRPTKGMHDPVPVRAFGPDAPKTQRLLPGMTGTIKLAVGGFGESYVLPSSAVFSRSGTSYIMIVQEGRTKQLPVRVQLTDGKTVRVALMSKRKEDDGTTRDVLVDLSGDEQVLVARQLEVGDGTPVRVGTSEW